MYNLIDITLMNVNDELEDLNQLIDTSEDKEWSEDYDRAVRLLQELRASIIYCFKIEEEKEV